MGYRDFCIYIARWYIDINTYIHTTDLNIGSYSGRNWEGTNFSPENSYYIQKFPGWLEVRRKGPVAIVVHAAAALGDVYRQTQPHAVDGKEATTAPLMLKEPWVGLD